MNTQFDLDYRPETYWPDVLNQEQLLARVSGQLRRDILRQVLAEDGNAGLDAIHANEELTNEERYGWGTVHPACLGGEFLPRLGETEVEIARISLDSTTSDQYSIRASNGGDRIRYSVYDEYESGFELLFTESEAPLTLGELIDLIDGSRQTDVNEPGGLVICHWEWAFYCEPDLQQSTDFARVQSAWYPELAAYFEEVASEWRDAKRREHPELFEDENDCEEDYA